MDKQSELRQNKIFVNNMVESAIRIGLLIVLLVFTYDIIKPFIIPVLWGAIIAVALLPVTNWLEGKFGGRRGLAATLVVVLGIAILMSPFFTVSGSIYDGITHLTDVLQDGNVALPRPTQKVADIPLIGGKLFEIWQLFATNLEKAISKFLPEIKTLAGALATILGGAFSSFMMFIIALIISGGLMAKAETVTAALQVVAVRTVGEHAEEWTSMIAATIRSVLVGVIGVAFIQSMIIGASFFVFDIPGAGLLTLLVLILCIAQMPALLVVAPVMFYVYSTSDTAPTVIFVIWSLIGGLSDNILKPMLMGRGVDIPMPVILIGAIGGMLFAGIIGLFLGAIILSIWYELFILWINKAPESKAALATIVEEEAQQE